MRRKFLAPALVFIMCIGITMTAYASPQADQLQNQPQFTTNATSEELSIIKTLFSAEEYAELYPDVVKAHGNEEAALSIMPLMECRKTDQLQQFLRL